MAISGIAKILTKQVCIGLIMMVWCLCDQMIGITASGNKDEAMKTALLNKLYSEVVNNSTSFMKVVPLTNCRDTYPIVNYTDLYDNIYHSEYQPVWGCQQVVKFSRLPTHGTLMVYLCIDSGAIDFTGCFASVAIRTRADLVHTDTVMCVDKPGVLLEMASLIIEIHIFTTPPFEPNRTAAMFIHFYLERHSDSIYSSFTSQQTTVGTGDALADQWLCHDTRIETESQDVLSCYRHFDFVFDFSIASLPSYDTASETCAEHGGHVVHIDSEPENNFIWEHVLEMGPLEKRLFEEFTHKYYIGLQRNTHDQWIWLPSGRVMNYGKLFYLTTTSGDRKREIEALGRCAVLGRLRFWYPAQCESTIDVRGFICERENTGYRASMSRIATEEPETNTDKAANEDMSTTQEYQETNQALLSLYAGIPLLVLVCTYAIVMWRKRGKRKRKKSDQIHKTSAPLELSPILMKSLTQDVQLRLRTLLLSRDNLDIQEELGRGAFGAVSKGIIILYEGDVSNVQTVAIKSLTGNCMGSDITAFINEAITMAELQHPHVLSIIGVCIDSKRDVPMIILPYMANGDLRTYLRTLRRDDRSGEPTDERQLLLFCLHISLGMNYLSNQKIIHRDLAARNCMVDSELLVKVADFGLARDVYSDSYYRQDQQKLLPVRWMAIECLHDHVFSIQSDIWSFGVTMWEVLSLGVVPYMHLDNAHIAAHLQAGNRLDQPELCPTEMYSLMGKCFENSPSDRPTFAVISEIISNYIAQMCDYLNVNDEAAVNDNVCLEAKVDNCLNHQIKRCTDQIVVGDLTKHFTKSNSLATGFDDETI